MSIKEVAQKEAAKQYVPSVPEPPKDASEVANRLLQIQAAGAMGVTMDDLRLLARAYLTRPDGGDSLREAESDGPCIEGDGCPTEKSVLQRFWREHHKALSTTQDKTQINKRVAARYDFLMERHQHGHYETLFKCVHEELALQRFSPRGKGR